MIQVAGVLLALAFIVYACYKGLHIAIVSIVAAAIILITNNLNYWEGYSVLFVKGLATFVGTYYFIFILGSIFGQLIGDTGSASSIAYKLYDMFGVKHVLLIITIAIAILSYGGISVFVIVFTVVPLGMALLKEANLPKRCLFGCLCLGAGQFALTALPGTPSINNLVPTTFLGTTPMAAPLMGIIASVIMFGAGLFYLLRTEKKYREQGLGFDGEVPAHLERDNLVDWKIAILPLIVLIGMIFCLNSVTFSGENLPEPMFAGGKMNSLCAVSIALITSIALCTLLNIKRIGSVDYFKTIISKGAGNALGPVFNTGMLVGFGTVIQASPAFQSFVDFSMNMDINVYFKVVIAVNILAGITGSSSGGMTIFMNTLSQKFLDMGINPAAFHRLAAISSGGLDSLPQSGGVLTMLSVVGVTHKEAYHYAFWISTVIPIATALICALLANVLY